LSLLLLKCRRAAADKPAMDVSGWLVGLGIGAVAAAAATSAWFRQRRLVAELARRLEQSEHSRMDLEAHAHQVDNRLASMADVLARTQAAMTAARVLPAATGKAPASIQALLQHLGDTAPVVVDGPAACEWIDTEPSEAPEDTHHDSQHPAFAETMPAEFASLPDR